MKETDFTKTFVKEMRKKFPHIYERKIHGDVFQRNIADNLFCINSIFVAIEFKVQRNNRISITPGQIIDIIKVKNASGIGLIIAYDENKDKILIHDKRIDYKKIFLNNINKDKKKTNIDWDFEFNNYNDCIDMIYMMVENCR